MPRLHKENGLRLVLLVLALGWLLAGVVLPLIQVFGKSFQDPTGNLIGLTNYQQFFKSTSLFSSFSNSLFVAGITTVLSVSLGFAYAYALQRACLPLRGFFKSVVMVPLFAPTLLHGICLVTLFGNKGLVTGLGISLPLYGPLGIIMAEFLYTFPSAVLIMSTALMATDARLYEAAEMLGADGKRQFFTVTLPGVQYGLLGAAAVCFTQAFTDFGGPKVVGGNYSVLATEIYKQVIGQQNFPMGATVSVMLLLPAVGAFVLDRWVQGKQASALSARSVPLVPKPKSRRDMVLLVFCSAVALGILAVFAAGLVVALAKTWPYNLTPTLKNFSFQGTSGGGFGAFFVSLKMSLATALIGSGLTFASAYLIEKSKGFSLLRQVAYFLSMLPLALPGLVLGLAYIFFFNSRGFPFPGLSGLPNPFQFLYGGMMLMVLCNVAHFYTVSFLTCTTALKQLDKEFEAVSDSLAVPFWVTFFRVHVPVCLPAILETGLYYFVSAMATVSALIFLYPPDMVPASIAVVKMEDSGDRSAAAAMCLLIVLVSVLVRALVEFLARKIKARVCPSASH